VICDRCGRPIVPYVEARYTVADSDDGETGRHYTCHEAELAEWEETKRRIPELTDRAHKLLGELRKRGVK